MVRRNRGATEIDNANSGKVIARLLLTVSTSETIQKELVETTKTQIKETRKIF